MNLKSAVKYQINEAKKPLIIFYSIIYVVMIFSMVSVSLLPKGRIDVSIGGLEAASMIFIFIAGLNSFKETFRMFMQNSISRKTLFVSFVLSIIGISALMALLDSVNAVIAGSLVKYESSFMQVYGERYIGNSSDIQMIVEGFLWSAFAYVFLAMAGYFITTLYYRLNKIGKLLVSVGVPALITIILPFVDATFAGGAIFSAIKSFFDTAWGYRSGFNPYYSMVSCTLFAAIFGGASYLLIRRAVIKD